MANSLGDKRLWRERVLATELGRHIHFNKDTTPAIKFHASSTHRIRRKRRRVVQVRREGREGEEEEHLGSCLNCTSPQRPVFHLGQRPPRQRLCLLGRVRCWQLSSSADSPPGVTHVTLRCLYPFPQEAKHCKRRGGLLHKSHPEPSHVHICIA